MEFKGTKEKWEVLEGTSLIGVKIGHKTFGIDNINEEAKANALLISKAPEMLEIIEELCENLYFQLDRIGVCGEGDGKGRKADVDSYGGTELLQRAKQLIKEATTL